MNFLAHLYLSGSSDGIRLGNFIGDYVKGRDYNNYPDEIRKGIVLHRKIDSFTDNHAIVKKDKKYFFEKYNKYAGVVTDIIYDHYLAVEWDWFSSQPLNAYIEDIHDLLMDNYAILPQGVRSFLPYFIRNKWLKSYQNLDGIESVLIGMAKGTSMPDEYGFAMNAIRKNYKNLRKDFMNFFPEVIYMSAQEV